MFNKLDKSENLKYFILIYILIFILVFFLKIFNYQNLFYWGDETFTLYITDPNISLDEFVNRHKQVDDNPILYFYILRIYNFIMGYSAENIRLFSIIISTLSIALSYFYFKNFFKNYFLFFALSIFTLNIFIIWQSKEARIASSIVFFSLFSLIFFREYILKKKINTLIFISAINLFLISYYPFLIVIPLAQIIFLYFSNDCQKKMFFIIFVFSLIFWFLLFKDYVLIKSAKINHIGNLDIKFFFNYFFKSFFGSYVLGGISLLIVFFFIFKNFFKQNEILFEIILVLTTYIFVIFYSFIFAGINVPRYFIFLIPILIVIITSFFKSKRYFISILYLLITILNSIYLFDKFKIVKPNIKNLLKIISDSNAKYFFTNEGDLYNYYLKHYNKLNNTIKFLDISQIDNKDSILFLCLNYPRMHYGNDYIGKIDKKCEINIEKEIVSKKIIQDFYILQYKK